LNNEIIKRKKLPINKIINCGNEKLDVVSYEETLPNDKKYISVIILIQILVLLIIRMPALDSMLNL